MVKMKFAFIIMGDFEYPKDKQSIHNGTARIIGVKNLQEACEESKKLLQKGIDCIELCGAFGEDGAKAVIKATENLIPVGYVTHLPMQDDLYKKTFS